jgi:two-component system response regulator QseB
VKLRLLLVEDNTVTAESLADCLELHGHAATVAANGESALSRLNGTHPYDAVIVDQYMPALDGVETIRRMRRAGLRVPCVLVTAAAQWAVDDMRGALAGLQPASLVRKPYDVGELLAEVTRLVGESGRADA